MGITFVEVKDPKQGSKNLKSKVVSSYKKESEILIKNMLIVALRVKNNQQKKNKI